MQADAPAPKKKRGVSARTLFRRKAAERALANAAANALARADLVTGTGDALGFTPEGIALVEKMASDGATQNFIAATLIIPRAKWRALMGKLDAETDARMAFERGQARFEQDIIGRLLKAGVRWTPALIHLTKTKLGWKEAGSGPQVLDDRRIQIVVPDTLSVGQLLRGLDQKEIIDARRDKSIPLNDVTPKWVKEGLQEARDLAAPAAQDDVIDGEFVEAPAAVEPPPQVPAALPAAPDMPLTFEQAEERARASTAAAFAKANGIQR
jgi:hypothetical protein